MRCSMPEWYPKAAAENHVSREAYESDTYKDTLALRQHHSHHHRRHSHRHQHRYILFRHNNNDKVYVVFGTNRNDYCSCFFFMGPFKRDSICFFFLIIYFYFSSALIVFIAVIYTQLVVF